MESIGKQKVIEIWHLAQQGELSTAKRRIIHLLRDQPDCVPAWLILAELLDTAEQKTHCYQRVIQIDAHNEKAVQFFARTSAGKDNGIEKTDIPALFDEEVLAADQSSPFMQPNDDERDLADAFDDDDVIPDESDDTLAAYVVKELGSHVEEDDIIREVSLRGQMDWYEAEKYVNETKDRYALTIAKRRSPLLLIIAVPTLVAGIVWFVTTGVAVLANGDGAIPLIATLLESIRHFIGSIAMILGGSVGIYRVLKSLGKIK